MTSNQNTGSFPTWDTMRALEDRVAELQDELATERIELSEWKTSCNANGAERDALAARIALVRKLCDGWRGPLAERVLVVLERPACFDAYDCETRGCYAENVGVPTSCVGARTLRASGDHEVDTQLHHRYEPPPASTGPDGCRRCGQPETSAVHR